MFVWKDKHQSHPAEARDEGTGSWVRHALFGGERRAWDSVLRSLAQIHSTKYCHAHWQTPPYPVVDDPPLPPSGFRVSPFDLCVPPSRSSGREAIGTLVQRIGDAQRGIIEIYEVRTAASVSQNFGCKISESWKRAHGDLGGPEKPCKPVNSIENVRLVYNGRGWGVSVARLLAVRACLSPGCTSQVHRWCLFCSP